MTAALTAGLDAFASLGRDDPIRHRPGDPARDAAIAEVRAWRGDARGFGYVSWFLEASLEGRGAAKLDDAPLSDLFDS